MTQFAEAEGSSAESLAETGYSRRFDGFARGLDIHFGLRSDLVRDSFGYLLSKIIPGFFGLVSIPIFVRLIGVEEYGRLSVILPIVMALAGFGAGWLQQGILRFHPVPGDTPQTRTAFQRAVARGTWYSALGVVVVLLPVLGGLHIPGWICLIAGFYCASQLPYTVWLSRLQAELRPKQVLKNEAVRSFATFAMPVVLVIISGMKSFPIVLLGLGLGYSVPLLISLVNQVSGNSAVALTEVEFSSGVLLKLWHFGWAVGLWLMLCQILPVVGRSAIQRYSGYAQAGIYASMYELAVRSFSLFASPVMQAAHPRIMREWNAGRFVAARATIRRSIQIQALMFLPIEAVGLLFARPLTRLILGSHATASAALLPTLMLGGFLWQIALLAHKPLEIMQRTKTMLVAMVAVLVLEGTGNYWLVSHFGIMATAFVFVAGAVGYIVFAVYWGVTSPQFAGREIANSRP